MVSFSGLLLFISCASLGISLVSISFWKAVNIVLDVFRDTQEVTGEIT